MIWQACYNILSLEYMETCIFHWAEIGSLVLCLKTFWNDDLRCPGFLLQLGLDAKMFVMVLTDLFRCCVLGCATATLYWSTYPLKFEYKIEFDILIGGNELVQYFRAHLTHKAQLGRASTVGSRAQLQREDEGISGTTTC